MDAARGDGISCELPVTRGAKPFAPGAQTNSSVPCGPVATCAAAVGERSMHVRCAQQTIVIRSVRLVTTRAIGGRGDLITMASIQARRRVTRATQLGFRRQQKRRLSGGVRLVTVATRFGDREMRHGDLPCGSRRQIIVAD